MSKRAKKVGHASAARSVPKKPGPKAAKPAKAPARRAGGARGSADLRALCRSLPGVTEDIKWEDDLIFSIGGKMFAGFDVEDSEYLGFKCDDDDFDDLVERGAKDGSAIPAPYAARFGWVKVRRGGAVSDAELRLLLKKAHSLVAAKLPKRTRLELGL
jgi:predicted DNA-binding protein (MmcQ/YjbR family)